MKVRLAVRGVGVALALVLVAYFSITSIIIALRGATDLLDTSAAIAAGLVLCYALAEIVQTAVAFFPSLVGGKHQIITDRFIFTNRQVVGRIARYGRNLREGTKPDMSARMIGNIAIAHDFHKAALVLERAAYRTVTPEHVVNPCLFTIGRMILEQPSPDRSAARTCFNALRRCMKRDRRLVHASAFTVDRVLRESRDPQLRSMAKEFMLSELEIGTRLARREVADFKRQYEKEHMITRRHTKSG